MEEDPREIMQSVHECIERTCEKLCKLNIDVSNIKGRTLTVEDGVENEGIGANSLKFILFFVFSGGSDQSERDDPGLGQRHWRAALQRHR